MIIIKSFFRQVSIAEVERAHTVLHGVCTRAWAEDNFSVAATQSRILALTCNDDRMPSNQVWYNIIVSLQA